MPTTQLSGSPVKVYKSSTTTNRKALACLVGIGYYWVEVEWHDEVRGEETISLTQTAIG